VLVCAAEKDLGTPRCRAYYEALAASGWGGAAEWFESEGEEHVFFLAKPASDRAVAALMDRLVAFFTASDATDRDLLINAIACWQINRL